MVRASVLITTRSIASTASRLSRIQRNSGLPAKSRKFLPDTRWLCAFMGSRATILWDMQTFLSRTGELGLAGVKIALLCRARQFEMVVVAAISAPILNGAKQQNII